MNIFVGNLSLEITENDLRREFLIFGKVTSVMLMNDLDIGSGQGRKCGYVEMPSIIEAESAIERLQGKSIKGRQLDIIKALPVTRKADSKPGGYLTAMGFIRKTGYWGSQRQRS
jgi:RNA recognition motif-containing protein